MEETKKRIRRSAEQITADKIAALQATIETYKGKIAECEKKIEELKVPAKPKTKMKDVTDKIKALGLSPEEALKAIEKMSKK